MTEDKEEAACVQRLAALFSECPSPDGGGHHTWNWEDFAPCKCEHCGAPWPYSPAGETALEKNTRDV